MYDNPLINAAFTFVEPFPVGLLVTAISAAVLTQETERRLTDKNVATAIYAQKTRIKTVIWDPWILREHPWLRSAYRR